MKNLRKNTLLMLLLSTATVLTACNSGGPAPNNSNNNANMGSITNNQKVSQSLEEEGLLTVIGGNLEDAITHQVGSALWNLVTKGSVFPQTPAEWDQTALTLIEKNIQQIENQLASQNAQLSTIITDIDNTALAGSNLKVSNYLGNIGDLVTNVGDLIENVLPNQSSTNIINSLITGTANPFTGQENESMINYVNAYNISVIVPGYTSNIIDTTEQQLSCDPSTTGNTYYVLNDPSQNASSHPIPNLSSTCLLSVALSNAYNDLTQNIQLTKGSNIFYNLQSFNQMLDSQYLQIIQALTSAYYLDQLRLYLYVNLQPSSQNHITPLLTIDPNSNNLADLATAQAELQLAYNTRLSFVEGLFAEAKQNAFKYYTSTIQSNSMANNCNLNYESLNTLSSSQIESAASTTTAINATAFNGNTLSWDGSILTTTCNSTHYGQLTTSTDIGNMCALNGGSSYNLSSSDGYIRCGAGNYNGNNISHANFTLLQQTYYGTSIFNEPSYPYGKTTIYSGTIDPMALYTVANPASININFNSTTYPLDAAWNANSTIFGIASVNNALIDVKYTGDSSGASNHSKWTFNPTNINIQAIPMASYADDSSSPWHNFEQNSNNWIFVDDGVHSYMIGEGSYSGATSSQAEYPNLNVVYLQCIPGDVNCVQGIWENPNINPNNVSASNSSDYQGLLFSNGDVVALTQVDGAAGAYDHDVTTNQYTLYQWYNGTCAAGYINYGPANNPANPIPWGNNDSSNIISVSNWQSMVASVNDWGYPGQLATTVPFANLAIRRQNVNSCNF